MDNNAWNIAQNRSMYQRNTNQIPLKYTVVKDEGSKIKYIHTHTHMQIKNNTHKRWQKESWEIFYLEYCDKRNILEHSHFFLLLFLHGG